VNANVQREGFFCGDGGGKPKFRLPYKYFKKKKREISSICKRIRGLVVSYVLSIKHWVVSGGSEQVDDVVSKLRLRPLLVPSESRSRRRDSSRKKGAKGRSILDVSWRMPIVQLLTHSPNSQVDACAHFDFISGFFSSNKQKVCFVFFSLSRFAVSNFLSILFFASSTRKTNFAKNKKKKCLVVYQLQPKLMLRTMS
jgi:hypothetical protein